MASRDLNDLHPALRPRADAFRAACEREGIDLLIYCTWRSAEEQAALYAQGRTRKGPIVTWARPGESKHNHVVDGRPAALAFDCVPLRAGKPVWGTRGDGLDDNPADDGSDDLELWQRVGILGVECGLDWAGHWRPGKREFPHFELPAAALARWESAHDRSDRAR